VGVWLRLQRSMTFSNPVPLDALERMISSDRS
jgi:hypothetical protein